MSKSNQELNLLLCSVNLSTLLKDVSETLVLTHLMTKILMRHEGLVHGKGNENRSSSWDVYCYYRNRMQDFSIFSSEYLTVSYSYSDFYEVPWTEVSRGLIWKKITLPENPLKEVE